MFGRKTKVKNINGTMHVSIPSWAKLFGWGSGQDVVQEISLDKVVIRKDVGTATIYYGDRVKFITKDGKELELPVGGK